MKNCIEMIRTKSNAGDFRRLKKLLECASTDPTRDVIRSISAEKEEDSIRLIATDGRRLRADLFEIEAVPGLYEIKANTGQLIFLSKSSSRMKFPDWRKVLPSLDGKTAHEFKGSGRNFITWVTAGLGCLIDPELIALGEDEEITLYLQKERPDQHPAVMQNATTLFVQMPIRATEPWCQQIRQIRKAA